jgi:hypothetical protein
MTERVEPLPLAARSDGDWPAGAAGSAPPAAADASAAPDGADRSLLEDLEALYADGRTYLSAEIAFQQSRAAYVGAKAKSAAIFGVAAALLALLALIGLTVGLIITLAPLIGPLGATLLVVAVLLIVAFLCVRRATKALSALTGAFAAGKHQP